MPITFETAPDIFRWTLRTIEELMALDFEAGWFDFKETLRPKGEKASELRASILGTSAAMANTNGGFLVFGIKDRRNPPAERMGGMPADGDFLHEYGQLIQAIDLPIAGFRGSPAIALPNGNAVFVVRIEQSKERPHFYDGRALCRTDGGGNRPMYRQAVRDQFFRTEEALLRVKVLRQMLATWHETAKTLWLASKTPWPDRLDAVRFHELAFSVALLISPNDRFLFLANDVETYGKRLNANLDAPRGERNDWYYSMRGDIALNLQNVCREALELLDRAGLI